MPATLKSRIPRIMATLPARIHAVQSTTKQKTASAIRERAPRESGRLAAGYRVVADGIEAEDYWVYVEYGTSRQAAQPHVTPVAEQEHDDMVKRARESLAKL